MKRHLLIIIAFLCYLLTASNTLSAAHLVGGELSYTCLGDDNYHVELTIYRDCNCTGCAQFDDPAHITIFDGEGNFIETFDMFSPVINQLEVDTEDFCLEDAPDVCVERGYYEIEIALPASSNGYQLVYQRCCRNNTIANLLSSGDQGSTYVLAIPPAAAGTDCNNSSPQFNNFPPIVICANSPLLFDHSATDADGDSLVYSICQPFQGASTADPYPSQAAPPPYQSVDWLDPYSTEYPLASDPAMVIDPNTGQLTAYPNTIGQFVVGICVSEYRDGVLLSTNTRDFQFNVTDCVIVEAIANVDISGNDTICLGESVQLIGQQFSGDSWFWEPAISLSNPNILNPIASPATTTTYTLSVVNLAAGCGASSSITIYVANPVTPNAGEDQTFCPGQTVQLNGSGGDTYAWEPIEGLSNPNIANPIASPTSTTTYTLTVSDAMGACIGTDQVTVSVGTSGNPGDMPDAQVVLCDGTATDLAATGVQLDEGSVLGYALHTASGDVAGTILATASNGVFANSGAPIQYNTVYYVSSIVGPPDANGFPDLNNGCTLIAPGTPVVFLSPLQLYLNEYCDWQLTGDFTITTGGVGGYPAFDNTQSYTIGGSVFNNVPVALNNTVQTILNEGEGTHTYTLTLNDGYCPEISQLQTFVCYKNAVELTQFDGKAMATGNEITWITKSETDNDYFILQRSTNGQLFMDIALVDGAGTKLSQSHYTYLDQLAVNGISYYRLVQTDFNGTKTQSETISVQRHSQINNNLSIVPVPATDMVTVRFDNPNYQNALIQVYDATGRLIASEQTQNNSLNLSISQYVAGLYFVHVQTGNETQIAKMIKK
jgi:hypothetical protein